MRITLEDDREMIGQLLAFDKFMNLVLSDTEEFRRPSSKKRRKSKSKSNSNSKKDDRIFKRTLGLMIIRGEIIISISVEGPPPPEETRNRLAPTLVGPLPGFGRAAGRGMTMPPAIGRTPGLTGPPKGLGGPAPGMMVPRGSFPPGSAPPQGYRGPPPSSRGPPAGAPGGRPPQGFRGPPNPPQGFRGHPPQGFRGPGGPPFRVPPPGITRGPGAMSLPPGILPPGRGN